MVEDIEFGMIRDRYRDVFGAMLTPSFGKYVLERRGAALGYRCAANEPLFVEQYLDQPVEGAVSHALFRRVSRTEIVEIGNFASTNAFAMIELWGTVANDLAGSKDVAVATLTLPLRKMFQRIGVPFVILAAARPERLHRPASDWGSYYQFDPHVCASVIAEGKAAIETFLDRRNVRKAIPA
jgi:hypothetical protein